MKHNYQTKTPKRGQGMLEFALILPILLLIVYGMLEVGRALFIYSTVVTASRQAVRYGSATGLNADSSNNLYNDCAGIRAAAQNVDFLGVIEDTDILIEYDHGPSTSAFSACPPGTVNNKDRIRVTVSADFVPIVPIVPLDTMTLTSSSSRTIIVNISVGGDALP